MNAIERFTANSDGRDFVVGDIHGCFDQLRQALNHVAFDETRDRCFSVGDLVDRGPHSLEALEWLARPWFHACLGNHEEIILGTRREPLVAMPQLIVNGGAWWLELDSGMQDAFIDAFLRLPIAMEVATSAGRVGIVHADIPQEMSWSTFLAAVDGDDVVVRNTALWGRQRAMGRAGSPVAGIDRVVCGHTIAPDRTIHVIENVWLIDTGAFLAPHGHLTLLPLRRLFDPAPI